MEKIKIQTMKASLTHFLKIMIAALIVVLGSCETFFDPDQDLLIKEDDFFNDWYDYRAAEMGLYSLQQELAEQIMILGELRADLLTTTPNAERDLLEIQNFQVSRLNKYASPRNFYILIAACNNLQRTLELNHPEVLDPESEITNYDRLYGEVITMRAWAYFNAVRIYREIPYIPIELTSIDEIVSYVNSSYSLRDTIGRVFNPDGSIDSVYRDPVRENAYLGLSDIVDSCAWQIENRIKEIRGVKAIGVNHYIENDDNTWEVTIWNEYAMYYLLGQMYLYQGDLQKSLEYLEPILYINDPEASSIRYGLDNTFQRGKWKNILTSIDQNEHMFVIWFGKSHKQTNDFQRLFSTVAPNEYQLKPTPNAILYWESIWDNTRLKHPVGTPFPTQELREGYPGFPGDFYRGHRVTYAYVSDGVPVDNSFVREMLELKRNQNDFEVKQKMQGLDTVVYKYTIGKDNDPFSRDANMIIARAASAHLYAAEIYTWYAFYGPDVVVVPTIAEQFLNDGTYNAEPKQKGVRGRVGFADHYEKITLPDMIYIHHPHTNEVIGHVDYTGSLIRKQWYMEEQILAERARELAYEGERFYDLIRIAKRREDPAFLADMVASKFLGAKAEEIRSLLQNEDNWYLPFFLDTE